MVGVCIQANFTLVEIFSITLIFLIIKQHRNRNSSIHHQNHCVAAKKETKEKRIVNQICWEQTATSAEIAKEETKHWSQKREEDSSHLFRLSRQDTYGSFQDSIYKIQNMNLRSYTLHDLPSSPQAAARSVSVKANTKLVFAQWKQLRQLNTKAQPAYAYDPTKNLH